MKIALLHGYELSGSGSNEYTRYLATTLVALRHELIVIAAEPEPDKFPLLSTVPGVSFHQLPRGPVLPARDQRP